jgi:PEP-CTERM motif
MKHLTRTTRSAIAAAALSLFAAGHAMAEAVGTNNLGAVAVGGTISATHNGLSKNGYSDNPALDNSAWAHAGGSPWYSFQVLTTSDVSISLTPVLASSTFNPGITLWATGNSIFNGGSDDIEVGPVNGWTAPHSFNATGQIGDVGTRWASGSNGNLLQTLAYAVTGPAHTDASTNGWNEVINAGVNDISVDNTFEQGITGTATGNSIQLTAHNLASGWYTVYFNGTNTGTAAGAAGWNSYNLSVSSVAAVPEPGTWALALVGLLVAGVAGRRRQA